MIKVVLFDADGVFINGEKFSVQLARDYGISTEQTIPFFSGPFKECIVGNKDLKEELAPYLKEWGWQGSVESFLEYWFKADSQINEELRESIKQLRARGVRCFLATNQEKYRATYLLENLGFADVFEKVYASAHLGAKKPDQEFFQKVLADLPGVEKEEVLFWDDTLANIAAAKQFGIHAEPYTSFPEFEQKMKEYL